MENNYLQSLYYSDSKRALKENSDNYQFQTYLKIKIVEHRTVLTRLRTGCTYLEIDTDQNDQNVPFVSRALKIQAISYFNV